MTFTFTDPSGNKVSSTARFTIQDTERPSLACPANIHLPECVETASWTVLASDVCGGVTVVSNPPSGSSFPKGTTTVVHVTATDECGNVNQRSFTVTRDPDLVVNIDPLGTSPLKTCASGTGSNIVLGYGGGPSCVNLHAVASGGHSPYTYAWQAPAQVPPGYFTNVLTSTPTFCAGFQTEPCATYTFLVTVTDIHGCTETNTVNVNVINPLCTDSKEPKVSVCHRPGGNPANQQSLCISPNAVDNHLNNHDDCLGKCNATCVSYSAFGNGNVALKNKPFGNELDGNYHLNVKPNPFTTTTVLNFSAGYDTQAQLLVTDVNGRQVAQLYDGLLEKQVSQSVKFDADGLQPGLYFARLIGADGTSLSATVLLVR